MLSSPSACNPTDNSSCLWISPSSATTIKSLIKDRTCRETKRVNQQIRTAYVSLWPYTTTKPQRIRRQVLRRLRIVVPVPVVVQPALLVVVLARKPKHCWRSGGAKAVAAAIASGRWTRPVLLAFLPAQRRYTSHGSSKYDFNGHNNLKHRANSREFRPLQ